MTVLKNRSFLTLISGQLVSTFGNSLFFLALPWYVYTITGSKTDLAMVGVAQTLPWVAGLFAGVFVDRWRKRSTMIGSDLIRALLSGLLCVAALMRWPLSSIIVLVLLLQFAGTFFMPAATAFIPLIVQSEEISEASGMNQSSTALAQLTGTAAGGPLMGILGAPLMFLANAITFLVSVFSLFFVHVNEVKKQSSEATAKKSLFHEWLDGFMLFKGSKLMLILLASALVINFAFAPVDIMMTAWVKGPMHGGPIELGIVNAAMFVGMIIGGVFLGPISKWLELRLIVAVGLIVTGITIGCVGLWANMYFNASLLLLAGFAIGSLNGSIFAFITKHVPKDLHGRVFSSVGALTSLTVPVGMIVFGALMIHFTLSTLFVTIGVLGMLSGFIALAPVKDDLKATFEMNSESI